MTTDRPLFYVAFIVDQKLRGLLLIEAGIDLLAGPYVSELTARESLPTVRRMHVRETTTCDLAAHLPMYDESPARIEVIAVTREMVDRYNARHPQARLAWPPMPAGQPDYLSIAEVAKMSGRHRQTISQMIARGDLESRVCGARVVVLASSVREWMEGGVEEELTPDTAGR